MELFEVEKKETVTRKEAATRLRRLANLLSSEEEAVAFERGEMQFSLHVPEQVEMKVELEIGSGQGETELELELRW